MGSSESRVDRGARRAAWRTWIWLAPIAALSVVLTACEKPLPPPPESNAFRITDKFFDVKAIGDKTFLLLAYRSVVSRSTDAGQTWKKVAQPNQRSLTRLHFLDGKKGWAVGHAGLIYVTEDSGDHWAEQKSGTKESLFDVDFPSPSVGWAVGDLSTIVHTTDAGASWQAAKIAISNIGVREDMSLAIEDPIFYSTDFLDDNTGWISGEFGQIRFTQDGGQTWEAQHGSLLGGAYRDIMSLPSWLCIRMRDRMNGVAAGTYGTIISTSDGGVTWKINESPVPTPLYDIRVLPDGDYLLVGSSGVVLRGNPDKGWAPAGMPPGVFSWISTVDFDSAGNGVAGGAHGLVLTSKDFGKNWEWNVNG